MAAETSIIREFLVALGFQSDEAALKKFETGIDQATKAAVRLATAVTATAVAVSLGVTRVASNLERLYFASIKANDSAANLKAFDRAAQNFGTEAGEALGSAEALARFLRENPGGEGLLASLGVQTRDANQQLRGTTDLMLELGQQLAQRPYYLARQYAGMFGISEDTLRALRTGDFEREVLRMREQLKDAGFSQATKDAHAFMIELRDLTTVLQTFGIQVYNALSQRLGVSLASFTAWLRENGPTLAGRTAEILERILDVAERAGAAITWIVDKLIEWDRQTDGWSTRILVLTAVLKALGGFAIIGGVISLAGAFAKLAVGITAAAGAGTGFLGVLGKLGVVGATGAAAYGAGTLIQQALPESANDAIGRWIAKALMLFSNRGAAEALAQNDPIEYFRMLGWSREQATGIVANLQAESGMDPQATGDNGQAVGVAQWHPDRQQVYYDRMGKGLEESTLAEQLDFVDYEMRFGAERAAGALLMAATSARQAAEIVARHYERPANVDQEAAKRGELAVQLSQETNIHLHGGPNSATNARDVANEQKDVNAQLVRNFSSLVQ